MTVYKLTDQNMQTHNGFQWTLGDWKETSGEDELCSEGWLHCYSSPLLAVLLNPIQADIKTPRIFEAEAEGQEKHDKGLKSGYTKMRLIKEIALPEITLNQKIAFGIMCAMEVCRDDDWLTWANNWISEKNRTSKAADSAADSVAHSVHDAAAYLAARSVACSARSVTDLAADSAAYSAGHSAAHSAEINFIAIAEKAMGIV